jgi:F-type H+-transporting ATPase subunit c
VNKLVKIASILVLVLLFAAPLLAQAPAAPGAGIGGSTELFSKASALGAGLVVIGGGYGIGRLASSALESMARQPEVAGSVQTAMIIAAALIEGFTFYALFICSQAV